MRVDQTQINCYHGLTTEMLAATFLAIPDGALILIANVH